MEHIKDKVLTQQAKELYERCIPDERVPWEMLAKLRQRYQRRKNIEQLVPASWVLVPCPECDGEGYVEQAVPGGYFDTRMECFYPLERLIQCRNCHGSGELEVTYDEHVFMEAA